MKRFTALLVLSILVVLWLPSQGTIGDSPIVPRSPLVYIPFVFSTSPPPVHGAGMSCVDRHTQLGIPCSEDCGEVHALGLEWTHGWQLNPTTCTGVEAVPQISRNDEIGQALGGNSGWVIYLNEPEYYKRIDMSYQYAGDGLYLVLETYPDIKVLLPSASVYYLSQMSNYYEATYGPLPTDRLGISHHCYGWGTAQQAIDMCAYLLNQIVAWGLAHGIDEVWITEFGLDPYWQDGMEGTKQFMAGMVGVYRDEPLVKRHAWFQKNPTAWVWTSGELGLWYDDGPTELGELYTELGGEYHAYP